MTAEAPARPRTDPGTELDPGPGLVARWSEVAARMADLPIYNPRLDVRATAFRRHGQNRIGVVTTPWFMNAVAVPDRPDDLPAPGASVEVALPDGVMDAIVADLPGFGRLAAASLFSPMDDFNDPARAFEVACEALEALMAPPPPPPPALEEKLARPVDRRSLFFGRRAEAGP